MAKDRDDQLNQDSDAGLEFSLEEILAEYHMKEGQAPDEATPIYLSQRQRPASGRPQATGGGQVLSFPGGGGRDLPGAPPDGPDMGEGDMDGEEADEAGEEDTIPFPPPPRRRPARAHPAPPPQAPAKRRTGLFRRREAPNPPEEDKVLAFPEEEGPLAAGLHRLQRRADEYAEHMFEEEDTEHSAEVRRAERYIPGVDEEEPPRRERRPRREPPPRPRPAPPAALPPVQQGPQAAAAARRPGLPAVPAHALSDPGPRPGGPPAPGRPEPGHPAALPGHPAGGGHGAGH